MIQVIPVPGQCFRMVRTTGTTWVQSPMAESLRIQMDLGG